MTSSPSVSPDASTTDQGRRGIASRRFIVMAAYVAVSFISVLIAFLAILSYASASIGLPLVGMALLPALLLAAFFIKLLRLYRDDKPMVFVIVAIPATLAFCFFFIPDQIPDEIWHFFRVLNFTTDGNSGLIAPTAITYQQMPTTYADLAGRLFAPADWSSTYIVTRGMSSYLSHLYFIPGLATAIGRALNFNPFALFYVARMANAALFIVAGFWTVRLVPFGKTTTLIFLLNPIMIQQEASCSADAFVNAASLLYLAWVLRCLDTPRLSRRDIVGLVVLSFAVCISKYAYAPLLLILLPFLGRSHKKAIRIGLPIALAAIATILACLVLLFYTGDAFKATLDLVRTPGECLRILANTLYLQTGQWVESFAGLDLGNFTIHPWVVCFWTYGIVLILSTFCNDDNETSSMTRPTRVVSTIVVVLDMLLIVLASRGWAMEVDKITDYISGIQGRYFIPLLLWPLLGFVQPSSTVRRKGQFEAYVFALVFIYVFDLVAIATFFI